MSNGPFINVDPVFRYLDALRDSGKLNMWGAKPYVAREFALCADYAGRLHMLWMDSFDHGESLGERLTWAYTQDAAHA